MSDKTTRAHVTQRLVIGIGDGAAYASVADALRVAAAGDVLVLHPGVYEEVVKLTVDVTVTTVALQAAADAAAAAAAAEAAEAAAAEAAAATTNEADAVVADTTPTTTTPEADASPPSVTAVPMANGNNGSSSGSSGAAVVVAEDGADVETIIAGDVIVLANATLRGVQVRGRVDVRSGHAVIEHCDIHHGTTGVRVGAQCTLTLTSSRVHHCSGDGDGVYFMPMSAGEVEDTDVYECRVNGVHARRASVVLRNNRLRECLFGVYYRDGATGLLQDNTIEHMAKFGVYVVEQSDPVVRANVVRECGVQCVFVSQGGAGLWTDNTLEGSMHVRAGCGARLGENRVAGRLDVDTPPATTTPAAAAA